MGRFRRGKNRAGQMIWENSHGHYVWEWSKDRRREYEMTYSHSLHMNGRGRLAEWDHKPTPEEIQAAVVMDRLTR